jgi:hypothetical protein
MIMRGFLIVTVSFAGLTGLTDRSLAQATNSAPRHTWYQLNGNTATCTLSDKTPEEF